MTDVVVVTGGDRGIGAATAHAFGEAGWDVCVGYHADRDAAAEVVSAITHRGGNAFACQADVSSEQDVLGLYEQVDATLGPVRALINNAGIVAPPGRLDEMDAARMGRMFAVNVLGAFLCAREAVRRMSSRRGGSGGAIVNVSSGAARIGSPGEFIDYAASKAAIDTLTIGLAREVGGEGIRVNAVRPGLIDTEIHVRGGQPDKPERLLPSIPLGRAGQPSEVAAVMVWLCSAAASYVNGAIVDVTGGR